jgi:hypothetical protein
MTTAILNVLSVAGAGGATAMICPVRRYELCGTSALYEGQLVAESAIEVRVVEPEAAGK